MTMTTDITELVQRLATCAKEDAHPCLSSADCDALVEALEKAQAAATQQGNIACALLEEVTQLRRHADEKAPELRAQLIEADGELEALRQRIAELESRTVKLPYLPDDCDRTEAHFKYQAALRDAGIKVEADIVDADVSDRNQPWMVVAVHIDAGDFVKFRGQVYEVEETDFDDHDVTLWFVSGETLKCAAGCQIEVVSAPEEAE